MATQGRQESRGRLERQRTGFRKSAGHEFEASPTRGRQQARLFLCKDDWDEEKADWTIPFFTFNPKEKVIAFPTINAKQRVEQMKEDRELNIDEGQDDSAAADPAIFRKQGAFKGKKGEETKQKATDESRDSSENG